MERLISAARLKETLVETLEKIGQNPKMDGQEMRIIAACHTLSQMIDDAPTAWADDENDLSLKLLDEYERGKLFEYQELGSIEYLRELVLAEQDEQRIYHLALNTYGGDAQTLMVFEEMSELQKELCKHARGKDNQEEIAEEIADVLIMLDQMMVMHDCKQTVKKQKQRKLKRLADRLTRTEEALKGGAE